MRAFRYTDDDLSKIYGTWDMLTNFHEGNCIPTDEWLWPENDKPTGDELVRKVFETPFEHLKLFYGNSTAGADEDQEGKHEVE